MRSLLPLLALLALGAAGCGGAATPAVSTRTPQRHARSTTHLRVARIGSLPQSLSKASAVALPGHKLMLLGGYANGASLDSILAGPPAQLGEIGRLPRPTHDAAAALVGG